MSSPPAERFARNLRCHRRRADLSRPELAELAEMSRVDIGELEKGRRSPRLDTILKLSAGLGAAPCELLAGMRWHPGHYVGGAFEVEDVPRAAGDAGRSERDGP